ncbi:MAG: ImmA/IrrE family metallo-endopeptidase [Gordonia sp. (in: high G+C Gram-positive bacteria)]|uniref:ImmA/IrrE family metallo-endopeptidase n=1 Tax=Gordonia sp. (in: high G+C Gram-positive bacteria) TaxID=84139 RepID=UPI0039E2599C
MTGALNPWRWLRDHHPRIDIVWCFTDDGIAGGWDGDRHIVMDPRLLQAARRSVLAHELVHVERGVLPEQPVLIAREERTVDRIAARLLIPLDALIDAIRWCRGVAGMEMADEVWTDRHTLLARIETLTADERAHIDGALADTDWCA